MIEVEHLKKIFDSTEVFKDINLKVNDGDVVGVIGPSGSGKSLLLRCMIMLERADSGRIYLDGDEITAPGYNLDSVHKRIGMVFQTFNLFEHLSVVENVMSGLVHLNGMKTIEAYDRAKQLLQEVGLADKAFMYPRSLSSGEKQRVAIARTLSLEPEIILMDEPTSLLDPLMRGEVESVIRMLKSEHRTMVITTHEMELIRQVCNKVVFLNDGIVWEEGTPGKIFDNADRDETRRFVKALRVLEFDVQSADFDFIGMKTQILDFAYRNGVSTLAMNRLMSIVEEFVQMIIIQQQEDNRMKMTFEYNKHEERIEGNILFSGEELDPDNPRYVFSWPIIKMRATEIETSLIDEDGYTNRVFITIK
ncbi:MAG: amino acid ABC transporter ATP-binding protein [Lachnospiraceae bacterium]|nr:amino acid ABC transporter ATP-binding protein [Lachnospiraceae bacterium]